MPEETFWYCTFSTISTIGGLKILLTFAMPIFQGKVELETLELQPPGALDPQDIPYRSVTRPELAGALFRYIKSLENLQSFLNSTH